LVVVMVQIRMDEPWSEGILILVALVAAVPVFALARAGHAATRLEPGRAYLAFFLLLLFAGAAAWGLRRARDQIAATS